MRALVEDKGHGSIPAWFQHLVPQTLLVKAVVPLWKVTCAVSIFSRRSSLSSIHTAATAKPDRTTRGSQRGRLMNVSVKQEHHHHHYQCTLNYLHIKASLLSLPPSSSSLHHHHHHHCSISLRFQLVQRTFQKQQKFILDVYSLKNAATEKTGTKTCNSGRKTVKEAFCWCSCLVQWQFWDMLKCTNTDMEK